MDIVSGIIIVVLIGGILFEANLLRNALLIIQFNKEENDRKNTILLANYRADLEMVMLLSHNMNEFVHHVSEAMKGDDTGADHSGYA